MPASRRRRRACRFRPVRNTDKAHAINSEHMIVTVSGESTGGKRSRSCRCGFRRAGSWHPDRPSRRPGQLTTGLPARSTPGRHPPLELAAVQIGNGLSVHQTPAGSRRWLPPGMHEPGAGARVPAPGFWRGANPDSGCPQINSSNLAQNLSLIRTIIRFTSSGSRWLRPGMGRRAGREPGCRAPAGPGTRVLPCRAELGRLVRGWPAGRTATCPSVESSSVSQPGPGGAVPGGAVPGGAVPGGAGRGPRGRGRGRRGRRAGLVD
jgi:hypothetical protein